jgi:hypothetical protein
MRSNDDNHQLNDYETESTYTAGRNKNFHGTCYGPISNVSLFDFIKGVPDKLLLRFGIKTTIRPLGDEKLPLDTKSFNKLFNLFKLNKRQLLKVRRNGLLHRSIKKRTLWSTSWFNHKKLDFLLSLENEYLSSWVLDQKLLSERDANWTKNSHLKVRKGSPNKRVKQISSEVYFETFVNTLKSSPSLWLSTLNSWCPDFYKLEYSKMKYEIKKLSRLISSNKTHGKLRNVWIESPKGKWRMICVPGFSYRWYCRMWNDCLSLWIKPRLHENYHGFIYGRGSLSWWTDFIKKDWQSYDYIFEFDMASFFPNVNKKEGLEALKYFNVTQKYARHLIKLVSGEIQESPFWPNEMCYFEETLNEGYRQTNRNLPMGNALCPLISSLVLYKHFDEKGFNLDSDLQVTGYADDNMLLMTQKGYERLINNMGSEDITSYLSDYKKGIIIEPLKSNWIKKEGKWLKSLKNLGLVYSEGDLFGSTRGTDKNGPSTLKFELFNNSKEVLNLNYLQTHNLLEKYLGFITSRLFIGKFVYDIDQDFNLIDNLKDDSFGAISTNVFKDWSVRYTNNLNTRNFSSYVNGTLLRDFLQIKKSCNNNYYCFFHGLKF